MNRHHHQVIFNRARGALMAVGEGARRARKSASGQGARALMLSALLMGAAHAQIVADPNAPGHQRPIVLTAPNGVPLVNIQTPSAAGVSRNTYRQFDIGSRGAILNNSRTGAPSQLGGALPGNPWLATGSARVIVNEVNSSNPSYLNGPLEVAGQRAEVVIANPSGIQVNGAAFINALGVTLTTGTPVFSGGALDSYVVQRGSVGIFGAGLDTRGADYTAIFARATEVNADLWANYLKLVNGANTIDAATQQPTGAATPDVERLEARLKACGDSQVCRDKAFDEAYRTSVANDIELLNCKTTGNCDHLKVEYRAGYAAIEGLLDKGIKPDDVSLILNMETNAQLIIRRGLDKIQCATSACREQVNYLVGVGKGLAKVTPAGLVTGSGVMAYELTTALLNLGLTDTAVALAQGIAGLPTELQQRLASEDPQVRGEALVDALAVGTVGTAVTAKLGQAGYTATMRRIDAQVAAAKEAETIAARMREVAIHTDDARFSQVAQEIVKAEQAGWKTGDGKTWWPPENGKVPGTEQIVELKVGQRLDRYGGTSDKSSFLAPASTPLEQRALSNTTNTALHDIYIVKKPFAVEESRVMPWFGKEGMGLQYETTAGTQLTIEKLVLEGYLEKVSK
jgi:filamentous hemagglutinin family protein